jgi:glucose/arabinose dehydrogenase
VHVLSITDGDTLETTFGTVRVFGIDTPENCAPCYAAATERLKSLAGEAVRLQPGPRERDPFDRRLAYLFTLEGESIDEIMIIEGLAEAWKDDGQHRDPFVKLEDEAKRIRRGCLWADLSRSSSQPAPTPAPRVAPPSIKPLRTLRVEQVWSRLKIDDPVFLTHVPGSSGCLAVVSQYGLIRKFFGAPEAAEGFAGTFLDIRDRVNRDGSEEGLLGLAFHPKFAENGRFFVYYSAASPRRSVISEFKADVQGRADPSGERIIMEVAQPYANHNGGMLLFGPDAHLYIGLGDGGSGGDPHGHGQDVNTLLGSVLRIDVEKQAGGKAYAVPPGNPFERGGGAPEIWAYGLRNPWRFSFDRTTGDLWAGDVGQNRLEEIDIIEPGGNYGWNVMEGDLCFQPREGCKTAGLEMPVAVYGRSDGCSVTGGYVYRGARLPSLYGAYVYGDYCSGKIWALRWDGAKVVEGPMLIADADLRVSSFGEDAAGELYIVDYAGRIYRFAAPG